MAFIDFIVAHWDSILLVLCVCVGLAVLYIRGQKNIVYKILYSLVTEAEKQFGNGTGELKQAYVINKIYNALPAVLKTFISADRLAAWVDEGLELAKAKWAQNSSIEGYIKGGEGE